MLFKLFLTPLLILDGRLSVLVEILLVGSLFLHSLIGQVPRILEAKAEIVLAKLGFHIIVLRASNALAHWCLIFTLLRAELIVTSHPNILGPLLLIICVSSLPKLV